MNKKCFKTASLAAAIALAMGSTAAFAAPPAADQLPGQGKIVAGTVDAGTVTNGEQTINVTGNAVINWGSGTDINKTGTAGFNIGSGAKLHFAGQTAAGTDAVLNIDSSGNASQIMGALDATGSAGTTSIFVANKNGVIVGANATISASGAVGLIGNVVDSTNFGGDATALPINGTGGGDVTVNQGASITGGTIFISGGNNVNVDLGAINGTATFLAGRAQNAGGGPFGGGGDNKNATLSVSGTQASGTIATFSSAGSAANAGVLDLTNAAGAVDGAISNSGDLTLPGSFAGGVVNKGKLTGGASLGSLNNEGIYNPGGAVTITAGDLTNSGSIDAASGGITVDAGSLVNTGVIDNAGAVSVTDGVINNKGSMTGVASLTTAESGTPTDGQYLGINNGTAGSIAFTDNGSVDADSEATTTTGSFTNAGTLTLTSGSGLTVNAGTDIDLGGNVMVGAKAASATNAMGALALTASNGSVNLYSPMFVSGATLTGKYVNVNANLSAVDSTGAAAGTVTIVSNDDVGPAQLPKDGKFSVNIGSGATVSAATVTVDGTATAHPDVLLRGTLSGNTINLGATNSVSNVWGAGGGLMATGTDASVGIHFTGAVKVAPPMNDGNNFRYNYLKIDSANALALTLDPVAYETNGTSNGKSAVNILVGNDVTVLDAQTQPYPSSLTGAVVAGINNTENTHLVLQSTGSITAGDSTNGFFWPGYVYLGTVESDSDGNAMPGTFSALNTITTVGDFDNTLAGRTENAGGIHFATSGKVNFGGDVYTNANSWVNFGNDAVTQFYAAQNASNKANAVSPVFYHGEISDTGNIVTYGKLQPTNYFHTQPANSKK